MNVGIITASDKGYLGEREDRSGVRIAEIIEAQGYTCLLYTSTYFGFTEQEVFQALEEFGLSLIHI